MARLKSAFKAPECPTPGSGRIALRLRFTGLWLFIVCISHAGNILSGIRPATALSNVRLYLDSTFTRPTETSFEEGTLFDVIGESKKEHYDAVQDQQFKWYKVRSLGGQVGWIFGDALAVVVPDIRLDSLLRPFHKKEMHFINGFENAVVWVALLDGHENPEAKGLFNSIYREYYLVITNERGRSVQLQYGSIGGQGRTELRRFIIQELNGDQSPDVLMEQSTYAINSPIENRELEIYSFQGGALSKVFAERLTLTYEDDVPSPAFSKYLEAGNGSIRVAYVDYVPCKQYSLPNRTDTRNNSERCLEYVTYTYTWDKRLKLYKPLYKETRIAPPATVKEPVYLQSDPTGSTARRGSLLRPEEPLQVIKHWETYVQEKGVKQLRCKLYVKTASGEYGYLPAGTVRFLNIEHAALLGQYYEHPPLIKSDWKSNLSFISVYQGK